MDNASGRLLDEPAHKRTIPFLLDALLDEYAKAQPELFRADLPTLAAESLVDFTAWARQYLTRHRVARTFYADAGNMAIELSGSGQEVLICPAIVSDGPDMLPARSIRI